jgi:multidrug efflux system outer membrane protein
MTPLKAWSTLPLALALTGCVSMAPKYRTPEPPVPKAWPEGPSYRAATGPTGQPAADTAWQEFYLDERLRKVLDLALRNNRDLRIAALNAEKARAYYRIQRADLLPKVNAFAQGTKQRLPASVSGTGQALVVEQDVVGVGISAWELDFFGRVRSLKNQALEQYLASEQARDSAQVSLLAEVANVYLALAADREALKLAQDTLVNQEAAYKLVHRRFEVGASSELDSYRAQVTVETARADAARYTRTVAMDENALRLLVGSPVPAEWLPEALGALAPLKDFAPGLPSEALTRRPDIRMAESQLKAANANIGAARAAFFPRISLTTSLGTMGSELSGLFKSGSETWAFSPQIVLPIFDTGARRANLKVANANRDIALAQYEKAIQVAFREVADALAQRGTLDEQLASQEALTQALEGAYRLAQARYGAGIDSYLSVLDAQRSLYAAQQGLIALRQARIGNLISLYKVLGGGWKAS